MQPMDDGAQIPTERTFTVTMWTLCAIALVFLASRFAVRLSTNGKIMANDYFLFATIPIFLTGFALLQSSINCLYDTESVLVKMPTLQPTAAIRRLVAAVELTWITIYCVKFCYLAQFKFYKPPYSYVDPLLTKYYWATNGLCCAGFVFTIIQPIILCQSPEQCRYIDGSDTRSWEIAVTAIDIATDLLVISIPFLLVCMVNTVRSHTIANFVFKSLSVFNIIVAAIRLAFQYTAKDHRIHYVTVTFLLVVEATVALVMISVSGYRVVFLEHLTAWLQRKDAAQSTHLTVRFPTAAAGGRGGAKSAKAAGPDISSLDLPILSST